MIQVDREKRVRRNRKVRSLGFQILRNHLVDPLGLDPDGFWLASSTARNNEVPGIDPVGYLDLAGVKPVDADLNQAAGCFGLLQIADLQTLLVLLAVVPKSDEENFPFSPQIYHDS